MANITWLLCLKTESNGVTAEDVNRFERQLSRKHILGPQGEDGKGGTLSFHCLTDDPEGISEYVNIIHLKRDENYINDNWFILETFDLGRYGVEAIEEFDEKGESHGFVHPEIQLVDVKYQLTDAAQMPFFMGRVPHAGNSVTDHNAYLTEEQMEYNKKHSHTYVRFVPSNFVSNNSKYVPGFMSFTNGTIKKIREKFMEDPYKYQQQYGNNAQKFIEDCIEEDESIQDYGTKPGTILEYPVENKELLEKYRIAYENEIKPNFPYSWAGPTLSEDEENDESTLFQNLRMWYKQPLISDDFGHDVGDHDYHLGLAQQVLFVKADDVEKMHEDRFASLYIANHYA